ncbi:MAG: ROK family protein [Pyrinomonadaceae bacterium]
MAEIQSQVRKFVGVEASTAALHAVRIGDGGTILDTRTTAFERNEGAIEQLAAFIKDLRTGFGDFDTVGIAVPGLINQETHRVAFSAHMPEHSEIDLAGGVQDATGVRTIIENDANAAAYGEFRLGAGRDSSNIFYATLGSGIGGALILDGRIWRGTAGFAGEFGYFAINSEGMRLEDVASSPNIVRRTTSRIRQDGTSSLSGLNEGSIKIKDIIAAAKSEDDFAQMMLERTGEYIGTAVASVINLLNIEKIVLGGEIMDARNLVLDSVISRAKELSFGPSFDSTRIVAGNLGQNAAAAGVALMANED